MIHSKTEYEDFVIKILNTIISGHIPSEKDFPEFSEKDFGEVLYQCVKDELIIGYSVTRTADGNPCGQRVGELYVTIKGLSYIDSVKQARAFEIAQKAEKNSIAAKIRANLAFVFSALSIAVPVLSNLDKIFLNLKRVISYLSSLG